MEDKLKLLLEYTKINSRVCPLPKYWDQLWQMLPNKKQISGRWEPSLPLILGAWNFSSNKAKAHRLEEHLRYATDHGMLDEVDTFLRGLKPEHWFYGE